MGIVLRLSQTRDAGFSKQNYYKEIDINQRKNIKITKQGGKFEKKTKCKKLIYLTKKI